MIINITDTRKAETLFANWEETLIWSCLQRVMGKVYAVDGETLRSAMAVNGDFCFLAGKPDPELVCFKPKDYFKDFIIMVPRSAGWAELIETQYGDKAKPVTRYAMKKEPAVFDERKLQKLAESLPSGYQLKMIDEAIYNLCRSQKWSYDLVSGFPDYKSYGKLGLGVVVLKSGEPVSGASSYSVYNGGIEIEIDTQEEYRRQGLATACGATLITECRKRGLYPSWDAQNLWSAALAEKLGYHFSHNYRAYEIWGY